MVAGCCGHVAAALFYLCYAKPKFAENPDLIKLPAEFLRSSLDNVNAFNKPNDPKYVRYKRRRSELVQKNLAILKFHLLEAAISLLTTRKKNKKVKF